MGRIKTTLIKRTTLELYQKHGNDFTADFNKNKEVVERFISTSSPKIRNAVAGYLSRLVKKRNKGQDVFARPSIKLMEGKSTESSERRGRPERYGRREHRER